MMALLIFRISQHEIVPSELPVFAAHVRRDGG
jgi:hypothetical protein